MTQRYAHLRADHLKEAIKKIDTQLDNLLYNPKPSDEKES